MDKFNNVTIFPVTLKNGQIGCQMNINNDLATVADFLVAMDYFAATYLADCYGCDGCCHERAPLTSIDITNLTKIIDNFDYPAHQVINKFGDIFIDDNGIVDITLRRTNNGSCNLLCQTGKYCLAHDYRPFVCQSHFCISRSDEIEQLRQTIVNHGENELVRLLSAEEAKGAPLIISNIIDIEDYTPTPLAGAKSWDEILIKSL